MWGCSRIGRRVTAISRSEIGQEQLAEQGLHLAHIIQKAIRKNDLVGSRSSFAADVIESQVGEFAMSSGLLNSCGANV